MMLEDTDVMLVCLVIHSKRLSKLIGIAGTILENLDNFRPVRSSTSATKQIPEQPSKIFLLIRRAGTSVPSVRYQIWVPVQDPGQYWGELWNPYHRYYSRGVAMKPIGPF